MRRRERDLREDVEGNLDNDRREDENRPVIHPRWLLTRFVELTKIEELGLKLLSERGGEDDGHEYSEESVLKTSRIGR